jgi:hypothetical protein
MLLRKHHALAAIVAAFPIGIIVGGGYLWWFFPLSDIFGLALPVWLATMISLVISSLIATAVLGYALLRILASPEIVDSLRSRGLKVEA